MPFYEGWHLADAEYFEVEYGHDLSYPLHVHRCYEIIVLTSGEMKLLVDGQEIRLLEGEAIIIFPNQVHALDTATASAHRLVIFSPEMVTAFHRQFQDRLPVDPHFTLRGSPLYPLFLGFGNDADVVEAKGMLYSLCAYAQKKIQFFSQSNIMTGNVPLLRRILGFIQSNYQDDCTLATLSSTIKYDMTYLSKFFTHSVGISFTSYVNQVRMAHACYLLRNTDKSILEISHACGNTSLRTFNRNFLDSMGCTPSVYRAQKDTNENG